MNNKIKKPTINKPSLRHAEGKITLDHSNFAEKKERDPINWYDDDDFDPCTHERFDTKDIRGLTLKEVREWIFDLCEEHGEDAILSQLDLDRDHPSLVIESPMNMWTKE